MDAEAERWRLDVEWKEGRWAAVLGCGGHRRRGGRVADRRGGRGSAVAGDWSGEVWKALCRTVKFVLRISDSGVFIVAFFPSVNPLPFSHPSWCDTGCPTGSMSSIKLAQNSMTFSVA